MKRTLGLTGLTGLIVAAALALPATAANAADKLPIFDAHVHYSHDAVETLPTKDAVAALRDAGVKKALVSSSDDAGTQKLLEAAPDLIVPSLRPYRARGSIGTWMHDPSVIDYINDKLSKFEYRAIGEFHAYGDDIETKVLQHVIAVAKKHKLLLHAHSDADAVDRIFKHYPDALVLWAHSGFDEPEKVAEMLKKHPNLYADLAFRSDQASGDGVSPDWKPVFEAFPDRFMVGTDTFAPERWYYVKSHAEFSRMWLSSLPKALAENIAYKNADAMIARVVEAQKKLGKGE